ncbi:polysaccharide deacetylase family protein [Parablautia intestinalis]|uniref:polysaccharide deacetylase family protein n=1 Tax=Parablautia intestinalis TaxID=2320100 RepID=UPI00256F6137|nr:polysaccharide deacetylase family protein [Parablautia intestinalis]
MSGFIMRFPEGKAKALTLSYDDGVEQDKRLMEIMDKNGLKGTFNLNSGLFAPEGTVYPQGTIHRRLTGEQAAKLYTDSGHEIAVHGLTHPFLEKLPENMVMWELLKDRENLETKFHTIVRGMAYPFGTYNSVTVDCLKGAGLVYGRTVISSHSFDIPEDWLTLPATCHHDDPELMKLAKQFVEETPRQNSRMFYLWGHSYEFEEHDNWNVIEEFAAYTGSRDDIWYATNIQIYDYIQAYQRLEFSVNGRRVYNPTATELYFEEQGNAANQYCILPGECLEL